MGEMKEIWEHLLGLKMGRWSKLDQIDFGGNSRSIGGLGLGTWDHRILRWTRSGGLKSVADRSNSLLFKLSGLNKSPIAVCYLIQRCSVFIYLMGLYLRHSSPSIIFLRALSPCLKVYLRIFFFIYLIYCKK